MADPLSPNIVLTGFMGTGKSAVGRRIAELTGRTFVDLDAEIVAQHGEIAALFAEGGEEHFRAIEREMVAAFAPKRNQVIATGGGTMVDPDNVVAFLGAEVYTLTASPEEIERRVTSDGIAGRPLLAEADDVPATIAAMLAERSEAYGKFTSIDTTGKSIDDVVDALRASGADISEVRENDPEKSQDKATKILSIVAIIAFVIALILLIIVLSI